MALCQAAVEEVALGQKSEKQSRLTSIGMGNRARMGVRGWGGGWLKVNSLHLSPLLLQRSAAWPSRR